MTEHKYRMKRILFVMATIVPFGIAAPRIVQQLGMIMSSPSGNRNNESLPEQQTPSVSIEGSSTVVETEAARSPILALSDPPLEEARKATGLHATDRIAGVVINDRARAYPIRILERHEVVNDSVGETSFSVTWCPLCDSLVVFDRSYSGGVFNFRASGSLMNSNVLLYEEISPDTYWSQIRASSVSAKQAGMNLRLLPTELSTWGDWLRRHPDSLVLSFPTDTGFSYTFSPYSEYLATDELIFPVEQTSDRLPNKSRVLGVRTSSEVRAYPLSEFERCTRTTTIRDDVSGHQITLIYEPEGRSLRVEQAPDDFDWMYSFWFAWYAFYPETTVYQWPSEVESRL